MAVNLVETVMSNLKGPVLEQLAGWIGESPQKTQAATQEMIPTILSELAGKVSGAEGAGILSSIFDKVDDGILDNLGSLLKKGEGSKVAEAGGGLLTMLFGDNLVTKLIGALGKSAGIGGASSKSLLGFLAPVIFAGLKRLVSKNGLIPSVKWLVGLLGKQKSMFAGLMPKGLTDLLGAAESSGVMAAVKAIAK